VRRPFGGVLSRAMSKATRRPSLVRHSSAMSLNESLVEALVSGSARLASEERLIVYRFDWNPAIASAPRRAPRRCWSHRPRGWCRLHPARPVHPGHRAEAQHLPHPATHDAPPRRVRNRFPFNPMRLRHIGRGRRPCPSSFERFSSLQLVLVRVRIVVRPMSRWYASTLDVQNRKERPLER